MLTESGVQVDSSVAHQVSRYYIAADLLFPRVLVVVVGHVWSAFAGPVTAQTAPRRPRRRLRYLAQVVDHRITIRLSRDKALVLSDWLDRVEATDAFIRVVDDRAVWSALLTISGTLDKALVDLFAPDYRDRLQAARGRLLDQLGDFGQPADG